MSIIFSTLIISIKKPNLISSMWTQSISNLISMILKKLYYINVYREHTKFHLPHKAPDYNFVILVDFDDIQNQV